MEAIPRIYYEHHYRVRAIKASTADLNVLWRNLRAGVSLVPSQHNSSLLMPEIYTPTDLCLKYLGRFLSDVGANKMSCLPRAEKHFRGVYASCARLVTGRRRVWRSHRVFLTFARSFQLSVWWIFARSGGRKNKAWKESECNPIN